MFLNALVSSRRSVSSSVYVVVLFSILGSIFTFLFSFFMLIYDNEYETKETKN